MKLAAGFSGDEEQRRHEVGKRSAKKDTMCG
jgi:hypothetical protein